MQISAALSRNLDRSPVFRSFGRWHVGKSSVSVYIDVCTLSRHLDHSASLHAAGSSGVSELCFLHFGSATVRTYEWDDEAKLGSCRNTTAVYRVTSAGVWFLRLAYKFCPCNLDQVLPRGKEWRKNNAQYYRQSRYRSTTVRGCGP
jgi:hypothetical protein